jgi:transposase
VFRGRSGKLIKILWHDGLGMSLYAKRLERGRFLWPSSADGVVTITPAQLGYLLEGIDWRMRSARTRAFPHYVPFDICESPSASRTTSRTVVVQSRRSNDAR